MPVVPQLVEFRVDEPEQIVAKMDEIAARGTGWITLQPGVDERDVPPAASSPLFGVFSGNGPPVPECTWTPDEIGVRHASGPKAVARLLERGLALPPAWRVLQDHPKRGLAVAIPRVAGHPEVLAWLVGAGERLTRVPLTGDWRAAVYLP